MFAVGLIVGILVGMGSAVILIRYAMGLHEKIAFGGKDQVPVLGEWQLPITQSHTGDEREEEEEP